MSDSPLRPRTCRPLSCTECGEISDLLSCRDPSVYDKNHSFIHELRWALFPPGRPCDPQSLSPFVEALIYCEIRTFSDHSRKSNHTTIIGARSHLRRSHGDYSSVR